MELNDRYLIAATNTKGVFRYDLANISDRPVEITGQSTTTSGFRIPFTSRASTTHVFQALDSIGDPWNDLQTVTGDGAPMSLIDTTTPRPVLRLYRIKTL